MSYEPVMTDRIGARSWAPGVRGTTIAWRMALVAMPTALFAAFCLLMIGQPPASPDKLEFRPAAVEALSALPPQG